MPNAPLPGLGSGTGNWWLVFYTQSQASVSSRLDPVSSPSGTNTATGSIVVEAATSALAHSVAQRILGSNASSINNISGPYASQPAAETAGQQADSTIAKATQAGNIPNPLSGLAAVGDFFQRLTQASTWIRVAEVGIGIVVILVVLDKLTEGTPANSAVHTAAKVAMVA